MSFNTNLYTIGIKIDQHNGQDKNRERFTNRFSKDCFKLKSVFNTKFVLYLEYSALNIHM